MGFVYLGQGSTIVSGVVWLRRQPAPPALSARVWCSSVVGYSDWMALGFWLEEGSLLGMSIYDHNASTSILLAG